MTNPVLRAAAGLVIGLVMVSAAVPAIAAEPSEGPGYGGKADKLDVAWSQDTEVVTASAADKPGAPVPQSLDGAAGSGPLPAVRRSRRPAVVGFRRRFSR